MTPAMTAGGCIVRRAQQYERRQRDHQSTDLSPSFLYLAAAARVAHVSTSST